MPLPAGYISPRNQIILTVSAVVGMIAAIVMVRIMHSNTWAPIAFFGATGAGIIIAAWLSRKRRIS